MESEYEQINDANYVGYTEITIIVVAYNRDTSLKRILTSLSRANYDNDHVRLVISIDKSNNPEVERTAKEFVWEFGDKIIRTFTKQQGLRQHILNCGDLAEEYDCIIVLEDDLYVSPNFYRFAKDAVRYYRNDEKIAGISLYTPHFNETAKVKFEALKSDGDTFFMQVASSWGQIWTRGQWDGFRNWYNQHKDFDFRDDLNIPWNIRQWPETSWKKYFMRYLLEMDKYFVYPFISHTTNFGDAGTHFKMNVSLFQVRMDYSKKPQYHFNELSESDSVYDIFCENKRLWKYIGLFEQELTIDIYQQKALVQTKYLLSTRRYNYKIIKSFSLLCHPIEVNIIENIAGKVIFLYNTQSTNTNFLSKFKHGNVLLDYFYTDLPSKVVIRLIIKKIIYFFIKFCKQK